MAIIHIFAAKSANNMWKDIFYVGIGGGIGSILRFIASRLVARYVAAEWLFAGTLVVNMTGCFLIVIPIASYRGILRWIYHILYFRIRKFTADRSQPMGIVCFIYLYKCTCRSVGRVGRNEAGKLIIKMRRTIFSARRIPRKYLISLIAVP